MSLRRDTRWASTTSHPHPESTSHSIVAFLSSRLCRFVSCASPTTAPADADADEEESAPEREARPPHCGMRFGIGDELLRICFSLAAARAPPRPRRGAGGNRLRHAAPLEHKRASAEPKAHRTQIKQRT